MSNLLFGVFGSVTEVEKRHRTTILRMLRVRAIFLKIYRARPKCLRDRRARRDGGRQHIKQLEATVNVGNKKGTKGTTGVSRMNKTYPKPEG